MNSSNLQFRFIEFSAVRKDTRLPAARILVVEDNDETLVWMSEDDLRYNIEAFGRHPSLVQALVEYGYPLDPIVDGAPSASPALNARAPTYPYGERVPKRIVMLCTTFPQMPTDVDLFTDDGFRPQIAFIGMELNAWTDSEGNVSAVFPDGEMLPVQLGQFKVIEWHDVRSRS